MTDRVPLALFTYNRPLHTQRALDALRRNARFGDVSIIIYSDAPKRPEHAEAVDATRRIVTEWAAEHRAEIVTRHQNLGLARSIAGSVDELTRAYGRVIVLEDDLVAAPDFLRFMLEGLERYADTASVAQIAGCLLTGSADVPGDAFFMPLTTTWGWATWTRAWRLFDWSTDGLLDALAADAGFRSRFNLDYVADYQSMLSDRIAGKNDSWGILWWYAVARANAQVLYPRMSLVWNGGFDNSGVHCAGDLPFQPEAPPQFRSSNLPAELRMPDSAEPNMAAFADVCSFLRGGTGAVPPATQKGIVARSLRKLRRHWSGR
ncbi:glycosyltransferase [Bradyrhizobium liaoningense]|uniref:glycosyltransferase n=1 Tax=Bradyrhizobium liaoningense TaxID=43992 RepID=UPI001BA63B00|nr:glycosyltransferase [Bradyrhizobium liaoningense]MBR0843864.1 glycosyltransferase [Bradyrhizobium liaoningense]